MKCPVTGNNHPNNQYCREFHDWAICYLCTKGAITENRSFDWKMIFTLISKKLCGLFILLAFLLVSGCGAVHNPEHVCTYQDRDSVLSGEKGGQFWLAPLVKLFYWTDSKNVMICDPDPVTLFKSRDAEHYVSTTAEKHGARPASLDEVRQALNIPIEAILLCGVLLFMLIGFCGQRRET